MKSFIFSFATNFHLGISTNTRNFGTIITTAIMNSIIKIRDNNVAIPAPSKARAGNPQLP
jgi:hypothetical protein